MEHGISRVAVLTVTYGNRWHFLSQVISAVMVDKHVSKLVIVDNGSKNGKEIQKGVSQYGEKVVVLRQDKNIGSAGGFAVGLEYVRGLDCDYALILDDDNVPEENAIEIFLKNEEKIGEGKVVLVGNRVNIPNNEDVFHLPLPKDTRPKGTFFESLSAKKIRHFFSLAHNGKPGEKHTKKEPSQFVPNESFVYGGSFIPIDAIRRAPLPDKNLVLYGDDIEYSWGIKRLGYASYVCFSPKIYDIEMSFGEGSQAVGLLDPKVVPFKTYYRIRNMIRISRRNTRQTKIALFVNIIIWILALFVLGVIKYGVNRNFFKKSGLIIKAVYGGYAKNEKVPKEAFLP